MIILKGKRKYVQYLSNKEIKDKVRRSFEYDIKYIDSVEELEHLINSQLEHLNCLEYSNCIIKEITISKIKNLPIKLQRGDYIKIDKDEYKINKVCCSSKDIIYYINYTEIGGNESIKEINKLDNKAKQEYIKQSQMLLQEIKNVKLNKKENLESQTLFQKFIGKFRR